MEIKKIVITGGPCGGKSTAVSWIKKAFAEKGYHVLIVPETATELLVGGVPLTSRGSVMNFQTSNFCLQLEKEKIFYRAALGLEAERVLMICDRGVMDNKAYMSKADFDCMIAECGYEEESLLASYDAVFHLVTAAKGAEAFYTTENNKVRIETPAQAAALDDRTVAAWQGHPYFRRIDNSTGFREKMERLISEMDLFLTQNTKTVR